MKVGEIRLECCEDRDQSQVLVNVMKNLRIQDKEGNFLIIRSSRRSPLCGDR
jgi:hypothetical protein